MGIEYTPGRRRAALQLRFDLLQFGEEEFLAFDFTTIFETNQVGFARRAAGAKRGRIAANNVAMQAKTTGRISLFFMTTYPCLI
jgi:hypothetical protein